MRKSSRHIGVLMVLSTLALGLVGAAYALWYEDLQVTANVSTGTFNVDLSLHDPVTHANSTNGVPVVAKPPTGWGSLTSGAATYLELGDSNRHFTNGAQGYANFTNANFGAKPQTTCTGALSSNAAGANDVGDTNVLTLNLGGLYPYAGCEFEIDLHNDGGIPFHIALTSVSLQSCTDNTYTTCVPAASAPWSIGLAPGSPAACTAFLGAIATATVNTQINTGPNAPVQIHDGQDLVCRFKLILDQANVENAFYKFSAVYRAFQWNEAPYGP